jgi:T4-like virus tail tube protein gp19
MPEPEAAALLGTSHFRVLIGREELGFAEVSPLSSEVDPESGEQFAHVVLRRALSRDTTLFDWRRAIVEGKNDRRTVTIHQLELAGGRIANSWRLVRAWPYRWSGPALNALESGVAFEEVELAYDDLVWVRRRPPRPSRRPRPTSQGA